MINKIISINNIRQGMILAADALNADGTIVVPRSTILSFTYVAKMQQAGIKSVNVIIPDNIKAPSDEEENTVPEENPAEILAKKKREEEIRLFRRDLLGIAGALAEIFEKLLATPSAECDYESLVQMVEALGSKYGNTLRILEMLHASRDYEDSIYVHSVCVTLVARVIGIKAQFNQKQLHDLVLCALMHDIGKTKVPEDIFEKTERLTADELELIRSHVEHGKNMLDKTSLPKYVSDCALYHHERFDGSGYPEGLAGQAIPFYARYVAVADVYSGMTSKRSYRESICPFDVVEAFERNGMQKYDAAALLPFVNCLAQSQIGSTVILNNGLSGQIVMLNERLTRPIIRMGSEFIDLMRRQELEIIKVI